MLEWTGERYLPWIEGAQIHYEHLHRYAFATRLVEGKTVLDLAFGEGYGPNMLAKVAKHVVGIEISAQVIEHAMSRYSRDNLEFMQGSILDIPIEGEKKFDVIVCFEGIEHVPQHEKLLSEVKRLLTDDGLFVVSTPNKKVYTDESEDTNPFHKKELYFEEFESLLGNYFKNIRFLGQRIYSGSYLWDISSSKYSSYKEFVIKKNGKEFRFTKSTSKVPLYFIALTSDADLSKHVRDDSSWLVDLSDMLAKDYMERINELGTTMIDLETQLRQMEHSTLTKLYERYQGIVEKVLRSGTKRRSYYELVLTAIRVLVNEGWQPLFRAIKMRLRFRRTVRRGYLPDLPRFRTSISQKEAEKLQFPEPSQEPAVSIVIPVYNKYIYTINCLKSICENTDGDFEVIVVDDMSTDRTASVLSKIRNLRLIRNEENSGFIESCNRGARASKGRNVLFLNNDTMVTKGWLSSLLEIMEREDTGAVGSKLVYPGGTLQEAGGIVWKDGSGWNYGRDDDPGRPEYNYVRAVDYCSGASLAVKKDLFEELGGFDERFKPGYCEDSDLCFSLRNLGYRVMYQPMSVVVHFEGITCGTDTSLGVKKYQEINVPKFIDKWGDVLKKYHRPPDTQNAFLARDRLPGKTFLVIDHYVPRYDKDSGSLRMLNMLTILAELGNKVTFIGNNLLKMEPYTQELQQRGIEVIYAPYVRDIKDYLAENGKFFDIVVLSRAHIAAIHVSSVIKYCKEAELVFDTQDLQFLRESRRAKLENSEKVQEIADKLRRLEYQLARMSDITFVVSPVEKEIMLREDPSLRIEVVPDIHKIKRPPKGFSERKDIMFLASFIHPPNGDAVEWFVREIFPLIREKIPGVKFYAVGNEPSREIKRLNSDDIIITGYVSDLAPYFENCKLFVSPLRYGAGIKGKVNHSMSYGLPVVTTSIGAEGMGLFDGENALIADTPQEFAEKVALLYTDEVLWNKLSENSLDIIQTNYSPEVIREKLQNIFKIPVKAARGGY